MTAVVQNPCPAPLACSSGDWSSLLVTRHGRKNRERGFPNQDAGHALEVLDRRWLLGTVADGHGGSLHPRSAVGSRLAACVSGSEWTQLLGERRELREPPCELAELLNRYPTYLQQRWRHAIESCHLDRPWRPDELKGLSPTERRELFDDPAIGYGTTLLSVALHQRHLLAAQIGDGAILAVESDGKPQFILSQKQDIGGYATDSLTHTDAKWRYSLAYRRLDKHSPAMLLLATDGLVNGIGSSQGVLDAAHKLWACWRHKNFKRLQMQLQRLAETAETKSHDDTTLLLLVRRGLFRGGWK